VRANTNFIANKRFIALQRHTYLILVNVHHYFRPLMHLRGSCCGAYCTRRSLSEMKPQTVVC